MTSLVSGTIVEYTYATASDIEAVWRNVPVGVCEEALSSGARQTMHVTLALALALVHTLIHARAALDT